CEIVNEDGTMARTPDIINFANKFNMPVITINDLVNYRKNNT
ncbi:MAG: 3,4-dihydroxy-2-butanone-4-phosphate synthase, partial [Candidatus Lightella neohaematopini]|nr:3,4-dihydroxy-2-butanone-4-phosphate synthase [Candidatus Lightella neohaematopini]